MGVERKDKDNWNDKNSLDFLKQECKSLIVLLELYGFDFTPEYAMTDETIDTLSMEELKNKIEGLQAEAKKLVESKSSDLTVTFLLHTHSPN